MYDTKKMMTPQFEQAHAARMLMYRVSMYDQKSSAEALKYIENIETKYEVVEEWMDIR